MRYWRRDVELAENVTGATFSLTRKEREYFVERLDYFKYLGKILHRSDEDWTVVLRNIRRVRQVWGRLEKLLRREGTDPIISTNFYHTVVPAVLLFAS